MQDIIKNTYEYLESLFSALLPDFDSHKIESVVIPVFASVFTTILTIAVFLLLRYIIGKIRTGVPNWRISKLLSLKYHNLQIISREQSASIVLKLYNFLALLIYLLLLYFYLNFLFFLFPATKGLATDLFKYATNAVGYVVGGIVGYLPNLIILFIIFMIAKYVMRFCKVLFKGIESGNVKISGFDREWASPTYTLVRILVIAFTLIMMFPYLPGSGSPAFQGVSIFLGVLLSLGGSGTVANLISGVVLTYTRAFKVGDRISVSGTTGDVVNKSLFVTRVMTTKNRIVSIPNSLLLNDHITNYTSLESEIGLILETAVTIGYDVPFEDVENCLIEAALATDGVEKDPKPFVLQTALQDYYVSYELNVYCRDSKKMNRIYSDLHRNIQLTFHQAGIEIASPGITAIRDGNRVNIPEKFVSKDYETPAFRLLQLPFEHLLNKKKD